MRWFAKTGRGASQNAMAQASPKDDGADDASDLQDIDEGLGGWRAWGLPQCTDM